MADRRSLQIERLGVRNYRALRDVTLSGLRPLTALVGPNGSGKSTVLDVFVFLKDALTIGLAEAWQKRGGAAHLRTRGAEGPVELRVTVRETASGQAPDPRWTYQVQIDEAGGRPYVLREELIRTGKGVKLLDFQAFLYERGEGRARREPGADPTALPGSLESAQTLALGAYGQFESYEGPALVRRALVNWKTLAVGRMGPVTLDGSWTVGDPAPLDVRRLRAEYPEAFERIRSALSSGVPRIEDVVVEEGRNGPELLFRDGPFADPIEARFASEGTRKLLAILTLLHDPEAAPVVGLEEPENFLHPQLLQSLADQIRIASRSRQFVVATHAPYFVDALRIGEVHVLSRDREGYTQARRADQMAGLKAQVAEGGLLGQLWMERFFEAGNTERLDPLSPTR